jgi:hypothetical protein
MGFKESVEAIPVVAKEYEAGIKALSSTHRKQISVRDPRRLTGSLNLDAALEESEPGARRWDYAVGIRYDAEQIYWIEVHPGDDGEIRVMREKYDWLRGWLAGDGAPLNTFPRQFVWISSGRTTFTPTSPALKSLAAVGVVHKGHHLQI